MNEKGISSLIATVMIIGLVVILGAIIFTWGNLFTKDIVDVSEVKIQEQLICTQDAVIEISGVCIEDQDTVRVVIKNNGKLTIKNFLVRLYESDISIDASNEVDSMAPFAVDPKIVTWVGKSEDVKLVEVIPKIEFLGKDIVCQKSKASFGSLVLDTTLPLCA